jgi:hypothetical protein
MVVLVHLVINHRVIHREEINPLVIILRGRKRAQGGNDRFDSSSNSSNNQRRRSRSLSPCTIGNCEYYSDQGENEEEFMKKCHQKFLNKTKARIIESKKPLSAFRTASIIMVRRFLSRKHMPVELFVLYYPEYKVTVVLV